MGHEAIVYGRILGASWRVGESFTRTHDLNRDALAAIPEVDCWPWLTKGIFSLPASYPEGTYRRQLIHFGLTIKDDPTNRRLWDVWLSKFEGVLQKLYWCSAVVHLETDFEPPRVFTWTPTKGAMDRLYDDPPQPIVEWVRSVQSGNVGPPSVTE